MRLSHCAIASASIATASVAHAGFAGIGVTTGLTDAQVNSLTAGLIVWEAEARFGDRGAAAERELGVGPSTAQPQADEAQVDWANDLAAPSGFAGYDLALGWDGVDTLTLDVTGLDASGAPVAENLVYTLPAPESVTDLYIRVAGNDFATSSISWDLLGVSGSQAAGLGAPTNSVQTRVSGSVLSGGFTLTGNFAFAWTDPAQARNARPSWQIKAAVPAPGAGFLALAAGVTTLRRRRR
ncbi:MAG: choice-of-anchor W domain-containing protein [Planctomycetota bacterium]